MCIQHVIISVIFNFNIDLRPPVDQTFFAIIEIYLLKQVKILVFL